MRKHITRLLLAAMTAVLSLTLVFGLGGCAPTGSKAYTAAEDTWYNYTGNKKAVDVITINASVNLGPTIGDLDLAVEATLEREYNGSNVKKITGTVNSVTVTGIGSTIETLLPTVIGAIGVTLPEDFDLSDYIKNGKVDLGEDFATGTISYSQGTYTIEGEISIDLFGLEASTDDLDEAIEVEEDVIDDYMDQLGLTFKFDSIGLYKVPDSAVTKENTASFDAKVGLDYLLQQAYDLLDTVLAGDLVIDDEEVVVPQQVEDIMEDVLGGTDSADIEAFLFGDDGLLDLGTANLTFAYDSSKRLSGITGSQTITFAITKSQIETILGKQSVAALLSGTGMTGATISNMVFTLAKVPTTIEATITISYTSTFTYA
jgi:hypothetical protein